METSDSECFESADEEISDESPPRTGFYKNYSNVNPLGVKEDLIPCSREENTPPKDSVAKDIDCLTNDNNNSLPSQQTDKANTSDTSTLLKQDNETNSDSNFSSDVSALKNEQWNEVDSRNELSKTNETRTTNLLTKEGHSGNLNKQKLLEDDEGIWEDDWSKETETKVDAKTSTLTKVNDWGDINKEKLLDEDENIWEDDWSKDEAETKTEAEESELTKEEIFSKDNNDGWDNDWGQWETVSNEKLEDTTKKSISAENKIKNNGSWGDWGNWGVTSLLTTATSSVSTITNQVTQGITNVLESGIGIPDPEELAKMSIEEKEQGKSNENTADNQGQTRAFNFETLLTGVTQITKLVENTGNKVISGGLDTLETIGKKTMEVLQEGDPGLKKKRAFLRIDSEKINLSQVLREAKEKSQTENTEKKPNTKNVSYETLFDDHHGLVHLEALEMLSKQCNIKLESIFESSSSEDLIELQETVDQIQELCELPEDEDEQLNAEQVVQKLEESISELGISISYDKLISAWKDAEIWMKNTSKPDCNDIHRKAIDTLAQVTAFAVEQFHKSAELLLIKQHRSTADEADSLVQITITLTSFIGYMASEFCKAMTKDDTENVDAKDRITNVYFEAANSSSYIKDAFKLLIPVIEVGAL